MHHRLKLRLAVLAAEAQPESQIADQIKQWDGSEMTARERKYHAIPERTAGLTLTEVHPEVTGQRKTGPQNYLANETLRPSG